MRCASTTDKLENTTNVVKPLTDDMEMFIRFCARPGTGPLALTPGDDTGGGDGTQKPRRRERGFG